MKKVYVTSIGEVYGYYTVIDVQFNRSYCRCRCGAEKWIFNRRLCKARDPKCVKCFAKMSAFSHKVVHAAYNAVSRCTNPNHKRYADWGGRGIRVHKPWITDIIAFCKYLVCLHGWDDSTLVLDRIDNNGHYEPGNLQWVTRSESQKNRRPTTRTKEHQEKIAAKRRGVPWTPQRREAYLRSHYRAFA